MRNFLFFYNFLKYNLNTFFLSGSENWFFGNKSNRTANWGNKSSSILRTFFSLFLALSSCEYPAVFLNRIVLPVFFSFKEEWYYSNNHVDFLIFFTGSKKCKWLESISSQYGQDEYIVSKAKNFWILLITLLSVFNCDFWLSYLSFYWQFFVVRFTASLFLLSVLLLTVYGQFFLTVFTVNPLLTAFCCHFDSHFWLSVLTVFFTVSSLL